MRLTKTLYIVGEGEQVQVGTDSLGRPIYETQKTYTSFNGEIEPYSSGLSETRYGVFVEVTNRLFCLPNSNITFETTIQYSNEDYQVTELMKYDRHYEVLLKKV